MLTIAIQRWIRNYYYHRKAHNNTPHFSVFSAMYQFNNEPFYWIKPCVKNENAYISTRFLAPHLASYCGHEFVVFSKNKLACYWLPGARSQAKGHVPLGRYCVKLHFFDDVNTLYLRLDKTTSVGSMIETQEQQVTIYTIHDRPERADIDYKYLACNLLNYAIYKQEFLELIGFWLRTLQQKLMTEFGLIERYQKDPALQVILMNSLNLSNQIDALVFQINDMIHSKKLEVLAMESNHVTGITACPYSKKSIDVDPLITKAPTQSSMKRIAHSLKTWCASPYKRIVNSYYCRHPLKLYRYVGQYASKGQELGIYKSVQKIPTFVGDLVFITEPVLIKTLLQYPRLDQGELLSEGRQLRVIADALGKFRLNTDKSDMKPKRSVLANLLMNSEKYLPQMFDAVDMLMEKWRYDSNPIVITQDVSELTVKIFLKSIMNYDGPTAPIVSILEEQIDLLGKRLNYQTPSIFYKRFTVLRAALMTYLYPLKESITEKTDYQERLSGYIDAHHQREKDAFATGVNSGTLAGYLAPNPAFIALVYELGNHPAWQEKLKHEWEVQQSRGVSREDYIMSDTTLLHAAIHEVLRMHPSQPFLFRNVEHDFLINKHDHIRKGSQLIIDLYHSLRDVSRWGADAALFNPMRFIEDPARYQKPFLVYSTGPNNCTGQLFSRQELKVFLQALCTNYSWTTMNNNVKHKFHFAMTLDQNIAVNFKSLR